VSNRVAVMRFRLQSALRAATMIRWTI